MNKVLYKIGDRFTIVGIEYSIIKMIDAPEPAYIVQNCRFPNLKMALTQTELIEVGTNFQTAL